MQRKNHILWILIIPSFLGMLIFYLLPFSSTLYFAMIDNMANRQFAGLDNFAITLSSQSFQQGLRNTLLMMGLCIPANLILSIVLALCLQQIKAMRGLLLSVMILPLAIPSGAVAYFWKMLFSTQGWLNRLMEFLGYDMIDISNSSFAYIVILLIYLWRNTGLCTALFFSGLQRIPKDYFDLAQTEGADWRWQLVHVRLMYSIPTSFTVLIFSLVNVFKVFRDIFIIYGNYPISKLYLLQHYMNNQFFNINLQRLTSASFLITFIMIVVLAGLFRLHNKISSSYMSLDLGGESTPPFKHMQFWGMTVICRVITTVAALSFAVPIVYIAGKSILSGSGTAGVCFEGYARLFLRSPLHLRMYWNSVIIVLPILAAQCLLSPMAAYAFEVLSWKHKERVYFLYMLVMLLPMQVLLVPQYLAIGVMGLRQSYLAIILPGVFSPFGIFLIRQQLRGFPKECLEAARLDGASEWAVFTRIILPNVKPGIAILIVFYISEYWNVIDQAIVFMDKGFTLPLSIYLANMLTKDPRALFATATAYMFPAILAFMWGQRYIVERGISFSWSYESQKK